MNILDIKPAAVFCVPGSDTKYMIEKWNSVEGTGVVSTQYSEQFSYTVNADQKPSMTLKRAVYFFGQETIFEKTFQIADLTLFKP